MSKKHHLRKESNCLNCGLTVQDRFCTHCGQENTETRQSFAHLVAHFFEDITHYDSGFWRTMKYLLFRPALLTREYLSGKRQAFVAPVRLYFFISFICFFLPSILPDLSGTDDDAAPKVTSAESKTTNQKAVEAGSSASHHFRTNVLLIDNFIISDDGRLVVGRSPNDYTSVHQMDSMQQALPPSERYNALQHRMAVHTIDLFNKYSTDEIKEKFGEAFHHNMSKALFVYLPFFAFFLWLFHSKKKWFYFDHAIFSIHYFSFLLLIITFFYIVSWLRRLIPDINVQLALLVPSLIGIIIWIIYYFYRAHRKFYGEKWFISAVKSTILFAINLTFIVILLFFFTNYTMYSLY